MDKKIVASELQEERDKCNFDQNELYNLFYPFKESNEFRALVEKDRNEDPELHLTHKYYEMTVPEK